MAKGITVDSYDVKVHERYAIDQAQFDPFFIQEASLIPSHSEIALTSSPVYSKWDELFQTHLNIHPWALFSPPPSYYKMHNRLFSRALSDRFAWVIEEDKEDDEDSEKDSSSEEQTVVSSFALDLDPEEEWEKERQEKEEKLHLLTICKEKITAKKGKTEGFFVEKERVILLNLLSSIEKLNRFLHELYSEKLRYQKG